jgi:hypothetical protein
MAPRRVAGLAANLKERLASTWLLLSDTTNFLSRTSVFSQYEAELMDMRRRMAGAARSSDVERAIRKELVELRAALRVQGYDLSLGRLDLAFQGFRNDSSLFEGFRRLVIFIGASRIWWLSGDDNHIVLHDRLDAAVSKAGSDVLQKHYLWYRWNHDQLVLSGSDTEAKDDFEALKAWCEQPEHRLQVLGSLRGLR